MFSREQQFKGYDFHTRGDPFISASRQGGGSGLIDGILSGLAGAANLVATGMSYPFTYSSKSPEAIQTESSQFTVNQLRTHLTDALEQWMWNLMATLAFVNPAIATEMYRQVSPKHPELASPILRRSLHSMISEKLPATIFDIMEGYLKKSGDRFARFRVKEGRDAFMKRIVPRIMNWIDGVFNVSDIPTLTTDVNDFAAIFCNTLRHTRAKLSRFITSPIVTECNRQLPLNLMLFFNDLYYACRNVFGINDNKQPMAFVLDNYVAQWKLHSGNGVVCSLMFVTSEYLQSSCNNPEPTTTTTNNKSPIPPPRPPKPVVRTGGTSSSSSMSTRHRRKHHRKH